MRNVELDFSGFGLRLCGLTDELAGRLEQDWAPFVSSASTPVLLDVAITLVEGRGDPGPFRPKEMTSILEPTHARFELPEGRAEIDDAGRAQVRLVRDLGSTTYYALHNLLRACLAWRLPSRSAALFGLWRKQA